MSINLEQKDFFREITRLFKDAFRRITQLEAANGKAAPGGALDADAIHDNIANEIALIATKATPITTDILLIEDTADANNKKKIFVSALLTLAATPATTHLLSVDSPYNILSTDSVLFCNTDAGAITVNLPAGTDGKHYKIINCGITGNDVTIDPNGVEQLFRGGAGVSLDIANGEVIDIHYNPTEGWF